MHAPETLQHLRRLCDRHGVLVGGGGGGGGGGRTGAMFAAEKAGVSPDIMTLGKALTGGIMPLAATIASERVFAAFYDDDPAHALMHGPTYSGHALACAVANASLDLFAGEPRLEQVAVIEDFLACALRPLSRSPAVRDVRVQGAVAAVEIAGEYDVEAARARFLARGTFIRPLGNVIYLSPAYTIAEDDLARLTTAITEEVSAFS